MESLFVPNNSEYQQWTCLPESNSGNKNAIFFVITDGYVFAAANVIMGLKQYSQDLMSASDIIIYHEGISEKHREILLSLHKNTVFCEFVMPASWETIKSHRTPSQWGNIVLCKWFALELVKKYEKVLLLDADMLIRGDISELFEIKEDIAWRKVISWNPDKYFSQKFSNINENISTCNAGLILFTNKVNKYNITDADILQAYENTKDIPKGGIDETLLTWIVYSKGMSLKELDVNIYNTPAKRTTAETKIVHFLIHKTIITKPWKNLAAYLYFTDWVENYKKWLLYGGEDVINFTSEDYYNLFSFELYEKCEQQKKKIAQLEKVEKENIVLKKEKERLENKLIKVKFSKSWKITAPLRYIGKTLRKIKKIFIK